MRMFKGFIFAVIGLVISATSNAATTTITSPLIGTGVYTTTQTHWGSFSDTYNFSLAASDLSARGNISASLTFKEVAASVSIPIIGSGSIPFTGFSSLTLSLNDVTNSSVLKTVTLADVNIYDTQNFSIDIFGLLNVGFDQNSKLMTTGWLHGLSAGNYSIGISGTTNLFSGTYSLAVLALPEAETNAMMLVGLGLIGFVIRKKAA